MTTMNKGNIKGNNFIFAPETDDRHSEVNSPSWPILHEKTLKTLNESCSVQPSMKNVHMSRHTMALAVFSFRKDRKLLQRLMCVVYASGGICSAIFGRVCPETMAPRL